MTQDWFNRQGLIPVQDRKEDRDWWRTDNLYTETDILKLVKYYHQDMQKSKNNIIDEWLEKYNDPQIEAEVKYRLKKQILDHLEERKESLEVQKKDVLEQIRKVRQGNMLEEAAENIGQWFEYDGDFFKVLYIDHKEKEVKAFFSKRWNGHVSFETDTVYEHEWRGAKKIDINHDILQDRINKLNEHLK